MQFNDILIYIASYFGLFTTIFFLFTLYENKNKLKAPKIKKYHKVSVIIPAYNEEKTVAKTIESVLNLDYPREKLDIMVVDDGSTDNTLKIAKKYVSKGVRVYTKSNEGKASALNFALEKAKGEFVGALDADSFVTPSALKKIMGYFRTKKVMAVGPSIRVRKPKKFWEKIQLIEFLSATLIRKIFSYLGGTCILPGPFTIFRKEFFDKYGGWDTNTITEDLEIALRIESKKKYIIEHSLHANVYTTATSTYKKAYRQRLRWFHGFMDNIWKYRSIFSHKYGNMGLFVLPISVLSVLIAVFAFIYSMIRLSINFSKQIYELYLIDFDLSHLIDFNFDSFFIKTSGAMLLPLLLLSISTLLIYISKKHDESKEPIKLAYIYFIVTYAFFSAICWIGAVFHKVTNKHVQWKK